MGEGGDKADLLARVLDPHITSRTAGALRQITELIPRGQLGAKLVERPILPHAILIAQVPHGHHFDKGEVHILARAPIGEGE